VRWQTREDERSGRRSPAILHFLKVALFLAPCLLTSWPAGCAGPSNPKQAIVILLDAARPDRFSGYGYEKPTTPRLDELAGRGLLFTSTFSQATTTRRYLPTFLFSRYFTVPVFPDHPSVPLTEPEVLFRRLDDESLSLPRALAGAGVATAVISAHIWIQEGTRFAAEFDEVHCLPVVLEHEGPYPDAAQVIDFALDWLAGRLDEDFFLYLHLMDTHFPHGFTADARAFFGPGPPPTGNFTSHGRPRDLSRPLTGEDRRYLDALYDGSLRYADRQVGRLLDFLQAKGRLDEILIVVTADHGEHLLEQPGRLDHAGPWYDTVARVPLIVSCPARIGPARIESLTEGIDIYPTILSLLEIPLPAGKTTDGQDLIPLAEESSPGREHVFWAWGVRGKRYKCLFDPADRPLLADQEPSVAELNGKLFDLVADPGETQDLWASEPDIVRNLLRAYRRRIRPCQARFAAAVTHEQPRASFAISVRHLRLEAGKVKTVGREEIQDRRCDQSSPGGWVHNHHRPDYLLLATPGAAPITIGFPMPDGRYWLSAAVMGSGTLRVAGANRVVPIQGEPFAPGRYQKAGEVEIGPIQVSGETFRATLAPAPDEGCFMVRRFGFVPLPPGAKEEAIDPQQVDRLRALGYVD